MATVVFSVSAINGSQRVVKNLNKIEKTAYSFDTNVRMKPVALFDKNAAKPPRYAYGDAVDTLYTAPLGTFFCAPFTMDDGYYHYYSYFMVAPNVPVTWTAASIGATEQTTYTWLYYDPFTSELSELDGPELTLTYPGDIAYLYGAPYLFMDENENSYFQMREGATMQRGGTLTFEIESAGFDNLVTTQDVDFDKITPFGVMPPIEKSSSYDYWNDEEDVLPLIQQSNPDIASVEVAAAVEFIDYGGAPYVLRSIKMPSYIQGSAGATVRCTVCPYISGSGIDFNNPIGSAEYVLEADQKAAGRVNVEFIFKDVDEFGLEEEKPIVIDQDIAIIIDEAYTDNHFVEFAPMTYAITYAADKKDYPYTVSGYMMLSCKNEAGEIIATQIRSAGGIHYWGSSIEDAGYPFAFQMHYDVEYPFIYSEEPVDTLEFAVEGEAKAFDIIANKEFVNLEVEVPEWLTVDGVDEMKSNDDGDEIFTGNIAVTATAEAATEYREGYIILSTPGAEYKVFCFQGEKGDTPEPLKGDVDGNGNVDGTDLNILINIILGKDQAENYEGRANVDGEGGVDGNDLNALINILLGK